MDFPHMVTEHGKGAKWVHLITDFATILQQTFISLFYLITTEANFKLPLKQPVIEHPVTKLFVRLDGLRKHNL